MGDKKKRNIIAVNPGSTSTKVALYNDLDCAWSETCRHKPEELHSDGEIFDQFDLRMGKVLEAVQAHGCALTDIDVAIAPGGLLPSTERTRVSAGAYEISDALLLALRYHPLVPHPVNMGPWICDAIARQGHALAVAYDATSVDEMEPILQITGFPPILRRARGHNLNMRTMAIKFCEGAGLDYRRQNIIIAHMGGGTTVALHRNGQIADIISDDILHFSATRCGGLPAYDLARYAIQSGLSADAMEAQLVRKSGLLGHLGTTDIREIEVRIEQGEKKARDVLEAMCINVAKSIAQLSVVTCGRIDHIILTGGIANSEMVTGWIEERVRFLAPVHVMPGEFEMLGLAMGAVRILDGLEAVREYLE